jgi:hypothetical protein
MCGAASCCFISSVADLKSLLQQEYFLFIYVKTIIAQFEPDPDPYGNGNGQAQRKAGYIDDGESFVSPDIAQGNDDITPEHFFPA